MADAHDEARRRIAEALEPLRWIETGSERYRQTRVGTAEEMVDAVLALFEATWGHLGAMPAGLTFGRARRLVLYGPVEVVEPAASGGPGDRSPMS